MPAAIETAKQAMEKIKEKEKEVRELSKDAKGKMETRLEALARMYEAKRNKNKPGGDKGDEK